MASLVNDGLADSRWWLNVMWFYLHVCLFHCIMLLYTIKGQRLQWRLSQFLSGGEFLTFFNLFRIVVARTPRHIKINGRSRNKPNKIKDKKVSNWFRFLSQSKRKQFISIRLSYYTVFCRCCFWWRRENKKNVRSVLNRWISVGRPNPVFISVTYRMLYGAVNSSAFERRILSLFRRALQIFILIYLLIYTTICFSPYIWFLWLDL